jgi:hypothetical protein
MDTPHKEGSCLWFSSFTGAGSEPARLAKSFLDEAMKSQINPASAPSVKSLLNPASAKSAPSV